MANQAKANQAKANQAKANQAKANQLYRIIYRDTINRESEDTRAKELLGRIRYGEMPEASCEVVRNFKEAYDSSTLFTKGETLFGHHLCFRYYEDFDEKTFTEKNFHSLEKRQTVQRLELADYTMQILFSELNAEEFTMLMKDLGLCVTELDQIGENYGR